MADEVIAWGEPGETLQAVLAEIEMLRQEKDRSSDKVTSFHLDLQKLQDQKHKLELKQTGLSTQREHLEAENTTSRDRLATVIEKISGLKKYSAL